MRKLITILAIVMLSGCAGIVGLIPSFWDDNQSRAIVDVQRAIDTVDCSRAQAAQVLVIQDRIDWFLTYSKSKGGRQADVIALVEPMSETSKDWLKRVSAEGYKENAVYCDLKKRVMQAQAARAAKAVLGRF